MYPFFQIPFMGRMFQWFSLGLWGLGFFFFGDLWSSKMTIFFWEIGGGRIPLNSLSQPSEGHTNVLWCISLLIFWLVLYFLYTYLSQGPLTTVHRFQPRPIDTLVRELKYPHWKGFGPDVQFIRYFPPPERVTPPPSMSYHEKILLAVLSRLPGIHPYSNPIGKVLPPCSV